MNTPYGMCVPGLVFRVAAQAGEVVSPGYPDDYPSNQDCRWLIDVSDNVENEPETDRVAVLKFIDFRIETLCQSERVEIYDGPSLDSPMIAKICGNIDRYSDIDNYGGDGKRSWYNKTMGRLGFIADEGFTYFASSKVMLVRFVTDSTWAYRGFRALYFAKDTPSFVRMLTPAPTTPALPITAATPDYYYNYLDVETTTPSSHSQTTRDYYYYQYETSTSKATEMTTQYPYYYYETSARTTTDAYDYYEYVTTEEPKTTTQRPQVTTTDSYDYYEYNTETPRTEATQKTPPENLPTYCYGGPQDRLPPAAYNMRSTAFQLLVEPDIPCNGVIDSVEFVSTHSSINFVLLVLRKYKTNYEWLPSDQSYWLLAYRNITTSNFAIKPYTWTSVNIADPISVSQGDIIGFMYLDAYADHETTPSIPYARTASSTYAGYAELWDWNMLMDFILRPDVNSPLKRPFFNFQHVSSIERPFRRPALRVRVQSGSQPRKPEADSNYPMVMMEAPSDPKFLCSMVMQRPNATHQLLSNSFCPDDAKLTSRIYMDPDAGQCSTTYDCRSNVDPLTGVAMRPFFKDENECSQLCSNFVSS